LTFIPVGPNKFDRNAAPVVRLLDHGGRSRRELKPFRDRKDDRPQTEIARKLYRQATNKIAGVSDEAAAFLRTYFQAVDS